MTIIESSSCLTPRGSITTIVRKLRQVLANLEHLVDLLLVLGEEHDRVGVAEQVLDLRRRARRVDANADGADALTARSANSHAGRFSLWIATRSPASTPSARSPSPIRAVRVR